MHLLQPFFPRNFPPKGALVAANMRANKTFNIQIFIGEILIEKAGEKREKMNKK